MLAEKFQPALSKAIHESLVKVIPENMPPITSTLQIDGVLCISMDNNKSKKIVVKIHDTIEPITQDTGSGRSSPWQIPLEKIQAAHERFLTFNGTEGDTSSPGSPSEAPIDLRGARAVSPPQVLQYTVEQIAAFKSNGPSTVSSVTNGTSDSGSESGKQFDASSPSIPASGNIPSPAAAHKSGGETRPKKTPSVIQCKVCSKRINGGLPGLQAHAQEAHQRYVCRFCYNTFSLRCNLKRHERLHAGLKPYNCKLCSKSFSRSTDLKLHMHKHGLSGSDVIVPCPQCPRTFLSVQNLRWHLYKVHKETEATFACTICEKLFMDKEEYMKHREDHTNNLIPNGPSSNTTTESIPDIDMMDMNSFDDSDSEQLMIDTQSEGEEEDISLPNLQAEESSNDVGDVGIELTSEPVTAGQKSENTDITPIEISPRPDASATPTPSQSSTGSTTGSRKRKIGKPTKVIEISDDAYEDFDISNMYYESVTAKAKRAERVSNGTGNSARSQRAIADLQDEPENLVIKPRSSTPPPIHIQPTTKTYDLSNASNTLSQIATALQKTSTPFTSPQFTNSATLQGFSPLQVVGLRDILTPTQVNQNRNMTINQAFPNATPILITPERYQPKSAEATYRQVKPKTGPIPHSVTPVSKSKIENITNEAIDENKEFQCVEMGCNETYLGFSAYEDHCMIRHGRYPCKYCKQTFSGKNNRTRHMRCHLGAKTYTCPDCNKNFSRPDSMREHQFIHTLSYQEDKCRNCGAAFDKKNMLLAHLKQCYRHKMETGKSTKFIDETPAYLNKDSETMIKKTGQVDDPLAPLKPIKLESIPAFRHIAPALDSAVPSFAAKSPIVATVFSLADVRGSPTMTVGASRRKVASPLNLSGGTLTTNTTIASPLTIPTVVANSSALPSPLVIVPTTSHVPATVIAAARASSANGKSSPVIKPASPLVIAPQSPADPTGSDSGSAPVSASASAQSSPTRYDSPVFPVPMCEPMDSAKDTAAVSHVLDAVKSLVKKRTDGKTAKDQNANTQTKEVEAGMGDE